MKKTIENYKIDLNFHKFSKNQSLEESEDDEEDIENENNNEENEDYEDDYGGLELENEDKFLFTYLNNRKLDIHDSGIYDLYKILSVECNSVEHAVSTTLRHKTVFDQIEKISKRKKYIPSENENFENIKKRKNSKKIVLDSIKISSSFSIGHTQSSVSDSIKASSSFSKKFKVVEDIDKQEKPFIEISDLINKLNQKDDLNIKFEREEIENILEDLHKLGLIVYFKKRALSDTIISNPQWFNNVFKSILDFGRKSVEKTIGLIEYALKETKNKKMKNEVSKITKWLKGDSKLREMEDIWNDKEELKKSNLDKISFENISKKLDDLIEKLIEQKEYSIFEMEDLRDVSSSISQKFIFIEENALIQNVVENMLDYYKSKGNQIYSEKKEFLMNILSQFDFVIPTKKLKYRMEGKIIRKERTYVVPLLFPSYKPSHSISKINKQISNKFDEWNNFEFGNEWIVDYFLPFKPSAVWKLLFMRIRGCCVGMNENEREMEEEIYWMNGFSFYLIENDSTKAKTFIELEFIDNKESSSQVLMKILIKSSLFDLNLFYSSLHQTIQLFVKEWIVPEFYNTIKIKIMKKKENKEIESIQNFFRISENLELKDEIVQYNNTIEKREIEKLRCFNCGFLISLEDLKQNTCDKCNSFTFKLFFSFYLISFNFISFSFK